MRKLMNINSTSKVRIGIDLGGTKIELVVIDALENVLLRKRIPTQAQLGPDHILNQIKSLYALAKSAHPVHSVGVGTPGSISARTGLLRNSNTVCLNGLPLQSAIENAIGCDIKIENDANCFALAEATLGAGKSYNCVFGVILGTGCGGGWIFNKQLRRGPQQLAGEWGHMVLKPGGLPCFCGHRGCVETCISGSGVERQYQNLALQASTVLSCENIFLSAMSGENKLAETVVDQFYEDLGQALANLINVMDPDVIVLGGGFSNIEGLPELCTQSVAKKVFTTEFTTPIVRHRLGDSAGVIGAALIGV